MEYLIIMMIIGQQQMSEFEVLLDFAHITKNVRNLIFKADYIALREHHLDILLVQFLQSTDDAVQRLYFVIDGSFQGLKKGLPLGLQLLHLALQGCQLPLPLPYYCDYCQVLYPYLSELRASGLQFQSSAFILGEFGLNMLVASIGSSERSGEFFVLRLECLRLVGQSSYLHVEFLDEFGLLFSVLADLSLGALIFINDLLRLQLFLLQLISNLLQAVAVFLQFLLQSFNLLLLLCHLGPLNGQFLLRLDQLPTQRLHLGIFSIGVNVPHLQQHILLFSQIGGQLRLFAQFLLQTQTFFLQVLGLLRKEFSLLSKGSQYLLVIIVTGPQCLNLPLRLPQLFLQFLGLPSAHSLSPIPHFLISLLHLAQLGHHLLDQTLHLLQILPQRKLLLLALLRRRLFLLGQLVLHKGYYGLLIISCDIGYFLDIGVDFGEEFAVVLDLLGREEGDVDRTLARCLLLLGGLSDGLFETTEHSIIIIEHEE